MAVFNERETELGELARAVQWRNLATRRIVELFLLAPSMLQDDSFGCSREPKSTRDAVKRYG